MATAFVSENQNLSSGHYGKNYGISDVNDRIDCDEGELML